jgi:hypothetical protein
MGDKQNERLKELYQQNTQFLNTVTENNRSVPELKVERAHLFFKMETKNSPAVGTSRWYSCVVTSPPSSF